MVDILMGLVIILSIAVCVLFMHIRYIKKDLEGIEGEQRAQNEDIYELMKANYNMKSIISQHAEILTYLADQDPVLGKKIIYTGPIGEA
jgi:hypothetical protein